MAIICSLIGVQSVLSLLNFSDVVVNDTIMKATATLLLALVNPATAAVYNMKWYASADCTGDVLPELGRGKTADNNIYTDICYTTDDGGAPRSAKLQDPSGVIGTVTYPSLDCTGTAEACPSTTLDYHDSDCVTAVTAGTCKVVDQNGAGSVMVTATTKPTTITTESPAYYMEVSGAAAVAPFD